MAKQQKFTWILPDGYDPDDLPSIAADIRVFIKDRSQAGFAVKGNKVFEFPEYNDEYRKAMKGNQRRVDLTLSEEMLDSIEVLKITGRKVTLGFEAGSEQNAKAEGNQIGSYGRSPNPKKARPFLGLTDTEADAILGAYDKLQ